MSKNTDSTVNPEAILREMDVLGSRAAEAIDQLLAQRRVILETAKTRASEFDVQIQRLNELYKSGNGCYYIPPPKTEADKEPAEESRRIRRSHEELEAYAKEIVAFVVSRGSAGVSGAEINERFPDISAGSIRAFVQKHAGVRLPDNGAARSALRYLPPA